MPRDLPMSRRAALKLTALGGAGLVASACTGSVRPAMREGGVRPTTPEPPPLPGRPRNVRVSQDEFVAHAEPCLAINPRDPRNLLGACIAHDGEGVLHIGAYASFDAGASWRSLGGLEDSADGRDPTVTFDATGRGYVCANTDDLHVWRTDDGGRTFAAPVLASQGHKLDHPWLAADPSPGPRSGTHLYGAWTGPDNTQLEFGRSTDGGRSFQAPRTIDTVQGPDEANFASPMVAAGHGGTVHAVYGVWPPLAPGVLRPEFLAPIRVVSSTDRGETWGRAVELGTGVMEIRVRPDTNGLGLPTVVAHAHQPLAAAAFVVRQPSAPFSDIAVCVSRDQGRTWSAPRSAPRVSDDTVYLQPQLAIDEAGRLALSAFAYRRGTIDVVVLVAEFATARFGPPVRVTSRPFDPAQGTLPGKHGAWWIGDYQGRACAAGRIHPGLNGWLHHLRIDGCVGGGGGGCGPGDCQQQSRTRCGTVAARCVAAADRPPAGQTGTVGTSLCAPDRRRATAPTPPRPAVSEHGRT